MSSSPGYNLELFSKIMQRNNSGLHSLDSNAAYKLLPASFSIIFGFKSCNDYFMLLCDLHKKTWKVSKMINQDEIIFCEIIDETIKSNSFFRLLLQIRSNSFSLDVNGNAIFTKIRLAENENFGGLMGLCAMVEN